MTKQGLLSHLLVFLVACTVPSEKATATHRALLIGINEYASPMVTDLQGAVNDVTMLKRILTTRFGFDDRNITVLADERATRADILMALDRLAADVDPDDFVYIHFSGHGSQSRDGNRDEDDGWDETILPHDARERGIPDITDDEFEKAFARLPTDYAFIVLDSCHSGTGTREVSPVRPRFMPPDDRAELYDGSAATTREVVPVAALRHVLMAGAPAGDEALDGPVDGGWYGLFSYALARSLDSLGPRATFLDLHAATKQELRRIQEQLYAVPPDPQLESQEQRLLESIVPSQGTDAENTTDDRTRRAWLDVERIGNGRLRMLEGASLNARPGSQWAVYGPSETRFEYGEALALGIVQAMDGRDAILSVQVENADIPNVARAIALAPPTGAASVPVRIEADNARRAPLEQAIASQLASVRFVGEDEFARFIVALEGDKWHVMDAGGLRTALSFPAAGNERLAEQLVQLFSTSATATTLLSLDNPAAEVKLSFDVVKSSPQSGDVVSSYRIRRAGESRSEENSLMLEIESDRDVFVTIVDVDTEGRVNLLFPNEYQRQDFYPGGMIPANTVVRIPDSLATPNRAGFHWDYSPPAGRDNVRVFVTTDRDTAATIRNLVRQTTDTRAALADVRSALLRTAVRGVEVVPDSPGNEELDPATERHRDWTAASVVIEVRE